MMLATVAFARIAVAVGISFAYVDRSSKPQLIVRVAPPVVTRVMFDPARLSQDVPTLHPNESALTQYMIDCRVAFESTETPRRLRVELALESTIYLPLNASPALREHEEGHRELNEQRYGAVARAIACAIIDESVSGKTVSTERELAAVIQSAVGAELARAGHRFDAMTAHGRNEVKVAFAVQRCAGN